MNKRKNKIDNSFSKVPSKTKNNLSMSRRSGIKIMASLILLLDSLVYIMILAIINGSAGFVCAMGVMVFGAVACAKAVGETIAMSYGVIVCLAIFCGVLRGKKHI